MGCDQILPPPPHPSGGKDLRHSQRKRSSSSLTASSSSNRHTGEQSPRGRATTPPVDAVSSVEQDPLLVNHQHIVPAQREAATQCLILLPGTTEATIIRFM